MQWTSKRLILNGLGVILAVSAATSHAATGREGSLHSSAPSLAPRISNPCEELVKECFSYTGEIFTSCLQTASAHSFCANSTLGDLVAQRWQIAPSAPGLDNAPALLGPKFVDRECLKKFDSQLSAHLGTATLTREVLEMLNKTLGGCQREPSNELLRP